LARCACGPQELRYLRQLQSLSTSFICSSRENGDAAHSAYNALIRRLVSFERAAACASRQDLFAE
jgi:hypothetical protein